MLKLKNVFFIEMYGHQQGSFKTIELSKTEFAKLKLSSFLYFLERG